MTVPKTILAVDDSSSMRAMITEVARGAGYQVIEAIDGVDALEKARRHLVTLVLTDQNMPRLDGLGLIRALRAMPAYAKTPMLLLTTESGEDMKQRGRAVRATGLLGKPFDPDTLIDVFRRLIG